MTQSLSSSGSPKFRKLYLMNEYTTGARDVFGGGGLLKFWSYWCGCYSGAGFNRVNTVYLPIFDDMSYVPLKKFRFKNCIDNLTNWIFD